ncbi:hypothetical protein B0H11DRAFT_1979569 [Mycena galericulata]|nr:hypothetical protein B0H11DRAFT_1979569 [Mycena galericulata]
MPIQIQALIHPDNEANFQAIAASKANIRTTRDAIHTACTNCFKNDGEEPDLKMSRCGGCKEVWYCSKECQKKHWRTHKAFCTRGEGSGILRLVKNFYSNKVLNTHIQACLIMHFDLLRHPQLGTPFMARVDLGIEPADMPDFFDIFIGKPPRTEKLKGMVQVNAFTPLPPAALAALTPMRKEIWRKARESADISGFGGDSIGLIELGNGESVQTITVPVHIQAEAMDLVRRSPPWEMKSAITGAVTEAPFNIETCMEFINTHIRADKQDQLLLRTTMRPSDIQTIRDAGADATTYSASILRAKMVREHIFKPLMVGQDFVGRVPLV